MAYITDQSYYGSSANYGSYQYVSLDDIVNNFMFSKVGEDKHVYNTPRNLVRYHAKQCIKTLNYDALKEVKALELLVESDLQVIMPPDFVDYVRISYLKDGVLYPMTENRQAMTAKEYDLDSNNDLQFDGSGNVLYKATSGLDQARLDGTNNLDDLEEITNCTQYSYGAKFWLDPVDANINPKFDIDKKNGLIKFNSTLSDKKIVIEYLTDGMEAGDDSLIGVHKYFEQYVYAYIKRELLEDKEGTPEMVMQRAKKSASTKLRQAKIRFNKLDGISMLQMLRGQNKWIK